MKKHKEKTAAEKPAEEKIKDKAEEKTEETEGKKSVSSEAPDTEKETKKNSIMKDLLRTFPIMLLCISANVFGSILEGKYSLPLWLDSFGTVFAAYILGPFCGAIAGASGNVIISFWDPTSLAYGLTSIAIGLSIGYAARRKFFETAFRAMSAAGLVTLLAVFISTTLNLILCEGSTDNIWGDGVRDFLMAHNVPLIPAALTGQLYLEFADKVVTVMLLFIAIKLVRLVRRKKGERASRSHKSGVTVITSALILTAAFCALSPMASIAADAAASDDQDTSYVRRIYNAENGLPCGHANDVAETDDGILWVGSYAGLYRYNGSTFRFMNEFDTVRNVNCLFSDREGRLWIGTNDNGLVVSINETVSDTIDSLGGLPSDSVRCVTQCSDGDYYIGTSDSLAVVRLENGVKIVSINDDLRYVKKISADKTGNVAAVTASGQLYVVRSGEIAYEIEPSDKDTVYTCCAFSESGVLYAGTSDGIVLEYEVGESSAKEKTSTACDTLSGINCISIEKSGVIWIASDSGIGTLRSGVFSRLEAEGFDFSLENIQIDYQGNVWVASSRLGLLQLSASAFTDVFGDYGLEARVVNTTALKDGKLYIGTDNGMIVLDQEKNSVVDNDLTKLLDSSRIRCIMQDKSGSLWICSYGKGLTEYTSDGKIKEYNGDEEGIGTRVRVCRQLVDGRLAVAGDKGLFYLKDGKVEISLPYGDELGAAKILCMHELSDGTIYCGTDGNGIVAVKDGKVTEHYTRAEGLTSGVILRMVQDDSPENLFVATGNSLCYMKDGTVSVLSNFPYSNNYDLNVDEDGDIFVYGSSGIYVVSRDDLVSGKDVDYLLLNASTGFPGSLTSNAWNAVDDEKNVYLSTDRGVYTYNMDAYRPKRRYYRLIIPELILDGVSVSTKDGSNVVIGQDVSSVEIVPEIVNYTLEIPNVSYCLEGIDSGWKTIPQNELFHIVYTNLPSGTYNFRIAIIDSETGRTLEQSSLSFKKEPAIYENGWFIVYMIVIAFIFIGWFTWFVTRVRIQRTMELQQTKLSLALQQVQMGNETILAIAKTVDAKDVRTSQHSQRVSDYAVMIAEKYGFSEKELENLRKSALLHDIGKIGIPDAILNKPSRLTDEEYVIMKTHVTRGAEILKDFTLIEHAVDVARYHHERYDGRGYPDGLKGEEIPLYGRIIAIADAFDAMTANRVYRQKQDFDYVMDELKKGRGTQFDPELLDIFLDLIESGEINMNTIYSPNKSGKGDDENE